MTLSPRDVSAVGGAALAALALGAAAWFALSPALGAGAPLPSDSPPSDSPLTGVTASSTPTPEEMVVDVQGAVARPGLVRLPPGSRVADAIAAAGGYTAMTDLLSASSSINLAATLADGAQVFVPIVGVAGGGTSGAAGGSGAGGTTGGLVNLNTASPEELESLPGIGPVTTQKIVAARQQQPFVTLEDLVERKVMNSGQLEDIRDLVTL